ncbi:unnamed protein product [Durusdinium trenchii]|uniref:Uncharacterized protein n=1 Tax=Durusdinium trenchii TaxID=1381693 RepID=A0ABP0LZG6_9DINO
MTNSCGSSRRPRPSRSLARLAACLLMVWLAWPCERVHLAFIEGLGLGQVESRNGRGWQTATKVRERLGSLSRKTSNSKTGDSKGQVKALTTRIKEARSAIELMGILDETVDAPYFDYIHAAAVYHTLATFRRMKGSLPSGCAESTALLKLNALLQDFIKRSKVGPRELGNVFWAVAVLFDAVPVVTQLSPDIARGLSLQTHSMDPQALSNCLWAAAHLKDAVPDDVLNIIPALAIQIPEKVDDMIPQALSNCLWASAQLKDVAPDDVMRIVPALAVQIPGKVDDMIPQHLSNCLWASAHLKEVVPDVVKILPALSAKLPGKADAMNPHELANSVHGLVVLQDSVPEARELLQTTSQTNFLKAAASKVSDLLPNLSGNDLHLAVPLTVWACGRTGLDFQPLLTAVARRFGKTTLSTLSDWGLCALTWSYQKLDLTMQFRDFQKALRAEVAKRGLSESDVEGSQTSYLEKTGQTEKQTG